MKPTRIPLFVSIVILLFAAACSQQPAIGPAGEGGTRSIAAQSQSMVIPAGTTLEVRLTTGVNSKDNKAGDSFEGSLEQPVVAGDRVAIPKGAVVTGRVTGAVPSGRLKQRAELWVTLASVTVKGKRYDLATTTTGHKEGSKATRDIVFIGGGAGAGAAVGGIAGGGKGAAIGTAIGAGAGTAGAMLTGQREIKFPPETLLRFKLEKELSVQP